MRTRASGGWGRTAAGVPLTVMTSNMRFGGADPRTIVGLVRENDVAVLAVDSMLEPNKLKIDRERRPAL